RAGDASGPSGSLPACPADAPRIPAADPALSPRVRGVDALAAFGPHPRRFTAHQGQVGSHPCPQKPVRRHEFRRGPPRAEPVPGRDAQLAGRRLRRGLYSLEEGVKPNARVLHGFDDTSFGAVQWQELLQQGPTDEVFLTWQWQRAWWESLGKGKLLLVLAERDGKPVALAPLYAASQMIFF